MSKHLRIGLVLALLFGSLSIVGAAPAEAICTGWHQGRWIGPADYGQENARYSSTCDGDKFYAGKVAESDRSQGDGHCAVTKGRADGGSWVWLGYSCRNDERFRSYNWNVGKTGGDITLCHGWSSWDCFIPSYRSWSM